MKEKLNLGTIILLGSFLLGIFGGMEIVEVLKNFLSAAIDPATLQIVGIIFLILVLGNLLHISGGLRKINLSLETFIKSRRLTLVIPSILIGLLPVPAGAMLSAPIVEESGNKMELNAEVKTFLNYWFRHIWEYVWPIYPGLILAVTILDVPLHRLVITQLPLSLTAVCVGYLFGVRRIPIEKSRSSNDVQHFFKGVYTFALNAWPILAIIVLVLILKLNLILSLSLIVIFTFLTLKVMKEKVFSISSVIKNSLPWKTILLVVAVMVFKKILQNSDFLSVIPEIFNRLGISPLITLFFIPFFIGLLTGLTMVFVGICFPLFSALIGIKEPNLTYAMLIYVGGFSGVLLSPVHLCLVTTVDYFKASFVKVYRLLILPVCCVVAVAFTFVFLQRIF